MSAPPGGMDNGKPRGYQSLQDLLMGEGLIGKDGVTPIPVEAQKVDPAFSAHDVRRAKDAISGADIEESYEERMGRRDGQRIRAFYGALGHMPVQVAQAITLQYISATIWERAHQNEDDE